MDAGRAGWIGEVVCSSARRNWIGLAARQGEADHPPRDTWHDGDCWAACTSTSLLSWRLEENSDK
jgi:hypothetical protein